MTGALVIFFAMVIIGILLYITDVAYFRHHHGDSVGNVGAESASTNEISARGRQEAPDICCGMHLVCEKTSLSVTDDKIEYYDDEELDRFIGRSPESYTSEEIEEFRDVLMTLLPEDIPGWAKSITLRKIILPSEIKDELYLLVSDLRNPSIA